jgi:hypothetical protein
MAVACAGICRARLYSELRLDIEVEADRIEPEIRNKKTKDKLPYEPFSFMNGIEGSHAAKD